jgi:hypothetical protein
MKNQSMADEVINLCETILPLDEMADGMGDYFFADKYRQEHQCLEWVLTSLADYPLQGVRLIKTGLNSRVIRERNMACGALSGWVKKLSKPLCEISQELHNEVSRICHIEVNDRTRETMGKLLGGLQEVLADEP